uniref:Predicted protein n=1 Tax=Hordeum vulgare subsp. vulgare TaxID=112509 RepID=F2EIT7_HORVV|nr:predicted protein [Hordeum vulgare subsp. vulgare]
MENISGKYEKYLRKDPPEGMGQWATSPVSAAPWWWLPSLWGPRGTTAPKLSSINALSSQKKPREKISSRLRYGGAATSCSSSEGQIWSPFWDPERGNRRHRHHQPSSLSNSMKLFIVRE